MAWHFCGNLNKTVKTTSLKCLIKHICKTIFALSRTTPTALSSLVVRQAWRTPLRDKMLDMARRRTACPSLVMLDSTTRDVTLHAQMSLLEQGYFELDSLENMVSTPSKDFYS